MRRVAWVAVCGGFALCAALVLPSFAGATTSTDIIEIPTGFQVFVPCADGGAGENVDVTGPVKLILHMTETSNGGVKAWFQANPQGVTGVGESTGDTYRGVGMSNEMTIVAPGGLPINETMLNIFSFIGPGPGNNSLVHMNIHVTINANGETTAEIDNESVTCK